MRQIKRFRALQLVYSPVSLQVLSLVPPSKADVPAEDIPLYLPSQLTSKDQDSTELYHSALTDVEIRLRDGQLNESLNDLRHSLLVKQRLLRYKKTNARHQGASTRSRTLIARQDKKVKLATLTYQNAWNAKLALVGDVTLMNWNQLRDEDVVCMDDLQDVEKKNIKAAKYKRAEAARRILTGQNPVEGAREKHRRVSRIWHGVSTGELEKDKVLYQGKPLFVKVLDFR
jgi:hypothetical protein